MMIFRVTMCLGDIWEGCADGFDDAAKLACSVFLAPTRAVSQVELLKVVDCSRCEYL